MLKGMDRIFSDQKPVMRGPVDEQDDDEGFGNGEPPEIKEFIEELGESGPEFIPQSTPLLLGLPLMMLLGCLTVSAAIWKECGNLFDMILLNSPLGNILIPKNVSSKSQSVSVDTEAAVLGVPKRLPSHPFPLESLVDLCQKHNADRLADSETAESRPAASEYVAATQGRRLASWPMM